MESHNENKIDLLQLGRVIWRGRKTILKIVAGFFILGLLIAFGTKVEYEATCKLLPESQQGIQWNAGGLSGLAELAGIDLDTKTGMLSPELFPEIVSSETFLWEVLETPVYFEKGDTTLSSFLYFDQLYQPSLLEYLGKYTLGLPAQIGSWFSDEDPPAPESSKNRLLKLSGEEVKLMKKFEERVQVIVENKTGIMYITAEMPDPYAAAGVTDVVVSRLTETVTNYKIEKSRTNLEFIEQQFELSKKDLREKQTELARFTDQNKNFNSNLARIEYQGLQNEYNIAFEVYKGLATQLEQSKITVKEQTPVFTVLQPVRVPVEKSKPRRLVILIICSFLGVIIGCGIVVGRDMLKQNQTAGGV